MYFGSSVDELKKYEPYVNGVWDKEKMYEFLVYYCCIPLQNLWKNYTQTNEFASMLTFEEILQSVEAVGDFVSK